MLTEDEKRTLRESWRLVAPIMDTAADLFYRRLFELQPGYRKLFPEDMTAQKRKLISMFAFAVRAADWAEESWAQEVASNDDLFLVVLALGRRHGLLYKIPEDAYPHVGDALLWSLNMGLGQAFTAETRAAWSKLYGLLSATMLIGARQAAGEQA